MKEKNDLRQLVKDVVTKIGVPNKASYEATIDKLDIDLFRMFDFLPDLMMTVCSYVVKETFTETLGEYDEDGRFITFSFNNLFSAPHTEENKNPSRLPDDVVPNALVFSSSRKREILFRKGVRMRQIVVRVNKNYLHHLLKEEAAGFDFLFADNHSFFIDEILTDDLLRIVNDIAVPRSEPILVGFHYRLKATELLFHLFTNLKKRTKARQLRISEAELRAVYQVRDKITSSLTEFSSIDDLKKIAGINEVKLRRLFNQVFGTGFFNYFQHFRMAEAARLLREENLSVSEVGYKLGFENLSHFSRIFKHYNGHLPKKYAKVWADDRGSSR
ncbi:MAG: helix-turn-helix transcriptional regulator [Williamsia sp.]|nr:helix-turn-helix transcriptional regulator [Williamsia sp.]